MEEARRREEERLKAQQALFDDMDRRPPRQQPALQAEPPSRPAAASSSHSAAVEEPSPPAGQQAAPFAQQAVAPRTTQQQAPGAASSSAYVPPTWNTRAPVLAPTIEGHEANAPLCGCSAGPDGAGPDQQLFAMMGLSAPTEESFEEWYQNWFAQEYFPDMSQKLSKELVQRARSRSFLSGISSQFKKWAMANTDARLQADVWFTYFQNYSPTQYRTVGCVKVATVNLGSQAAPLWLTFWGLPDSSDPAGARWILPPWSSFDVDIAALVDELDGRGGMSALLTSAM